MKHLQSKISTTELLFNGAMVFGLSGVTYWIITHLLTRVFSVSRDDDLLGGMWAVVATVFVYHVARVESIDAALTRIFATSLSFVLCFIYLLFFPFHYWGMAALLGLGTILMPLLGRPDAAVTTNITTTVVMVVAAMNPIHAWQQPILRMIDTVVGVAIALGGSLIYSIVCAAIWKAGSRECHNHAPDDARHAGRASGCHGSE